MGKNAHPPRGPKPTSKNPSAESTVKDASDKKTSAKDANDKKSGKTTPAAGPSAPAQGEEKKKPDAKTLIGGASWTGKLPVNLLSEHCQKHRWEKPEYSMSKTPEGFFSAVTLSSKNPKTQEMTTLPPFKLPEEHKNLALKPTALEARHYAAAYALFRVCNMLSLHMALPPTYRDLWKGEFQQIKDEAVKAGAGWKYAADPFQAKRERDEALVKAEKRREALQKDSAENSNRPGISAKGSQGKPMKGWQTVAKVEMGEKIRRNIEDMAQAYSVWNPLQLQLSAESRQQIVGELVSQGFRKNHAEEAAEICKDKKECLDWLLVHVPEDDLPSWCLPEGYVAGISMASGDLKRDAVMKRLASGGYSTELCQKFYNDFNGDELRAAQALQDSLLGANTSISKDDLEDVTNVDSSDTEDSWRDELEVISSIYGGKCERPDSSRCRITLEIPDIPNVICCLCKPVGHYPSVPPILTIEASLPAYIRLSITRKALEHTIDNFLGYEMIFNIFDWLEQEIPNIVSNPGALSKVSGKNQHITAGDSRVTTAGHRKAPKHTPKGLVLDAFSDKSRKILSEWERSQSDPNQQKMIRVRQSLPAWKLQESIVHAVESHQIVIISGETGSGKSTQSVQFILDDMIRKGFGEASNILCTQPRRISALGLADRVADERCSRVGQEIGYAIRGESKQTHGVTKITFVTTGVLLRRLQMSGGSTEDIVASLADISHIVVDEVHERSLDTDFLLAILRDVVKVRKDLSIILMSATLDAKTFEQYFGGPKAVAKVEIQGRTYPVDDFYLDDVLRLTNMGEDWSLEDEENVNIGKRVQRLGAGINYDLIAALVGKIDNDLGSNRGGILIFLPGVLEISRTLEKLRNIPGLHPLPLHASLLPAEQRKVFPPAPSGKRKVIVSTNVAETSITIEDIVVVIDSGRVKETRFDARAHMVKLEEVWASRAACKQRRGRAGRVQAGQCYKLYTHNAESMMAERPDPEIRRVPLEQLCLSVKAMGVSDVPLFIANTLTPPEGTAVEGALSILNRVGALDGEHLTSLGRHMSMIPADLRCAKLMIYGALFGYLEECVTIASVLSVKSPFVSPQDKREDSKASRTEFGQNYGDIIADLRAYHEWAEMKSMTSMRDVRAWVERSFLSTSVLNDISSTRAQYLASLQEAGFIPGTYKPQPALQNASYAFLNALILSALHPQIVRITLPPQRFQSTASGALAVDPESREIKHFDAANERVFVHPSSTLFSAQSFPNNAGFLAYFEKVETSKVFVRELAPAGAYALLLFGGPIELDTQGRGLIVDGWARLRGWARIGVLASRLRAILERVLDGWIDRPQALGARGDMEVQLVDIVKRLVEFDGLDR